MGQFGEAGQVIDRIGCELFGERATRQMLGFAVMGAIVYSVGADAPLVQIAALVAVLGSLAATKNRSHD
ncbi:MAG: hypothetical protein ABEI27_13965 [Halobellus sp.]|uniref:hypothetical protein n=1 Tax=Halobellus sp. TaxID=1979212 RepID=UPI0035D4A7B5